MKNEVKNMDVLTKEQKEYLLFKSGQNAMFHHLKSLIKDDKIPPPCFDSLKEPPKQDVNFIHEKYFYLFMEILQGKRPEYIDAIIKHHNKKHENNNTAQ